MAGTRKRVDLSHPILTHTAGLNTFFIQTTKLNHPFIITLDVSGQVEQSRSILKQNFFLLKNVPQRIRRQICNKIMMDFSL